KIFGRKVDLCVFFANRSFRLFSSMAHIQTDRTKFAEGISVTGIWQLSSIYLFIVSRLLQVTSIHTSSRMVFENLNILFAFEVLSERFRSRSFSTHIPSSQN